MLRAVLVLVTLVLSIVAARAAESSADLWKQYVADPDRHPLIPNCSYAGYQCGDVALPEPAAQFDGKVPEPADLHAAQVALRPKSAST